MAKVSWSLASQRDVLEIGNWIARDAPRLAADIVDRIYAKGADLGRFPRIGRAVPEWKHPMFRELIVSGFRVIYAIHGGDVIVLRVIHGARRQPKSPDRGSGPRGRA
jgi:plasmid stabilization system protein ParE